jgi:hypothetical protein
MRNRCGRLAFSVVLASALGAGVLPVTAGARVSAARPSSSACTSFGEFYGVQFALAFVTSFAGAAAGPHKQAEVKDAKNVAQLIFSPKLQKVTAELATSAPKVLRKGWSRAAKAYGEGVKILRDLGLTDKQIKQIANADLTQTNSVDSKVFNDKYHVTKAKLAAAGRKFQKVQTSIFKKATRPEAEALQALSVECGVTPDKSVDCSVLVTDAEVQALIGPITDKNGSCSWDGTKGDTGLDPELAVEVYRNPDVFTQKTKKLTDTSSVSGVGDKALVATGFSSANRGATCGKTLYVQSGSDTIVVALCLPNDVDPTEAQIVDVATNVLTRLSD